jgi:hypothetical protein
MSHLPVEGQQPVLPLSEREPAAIRAAVARLDPSALARFEADWTAATARAREYSLLPARYFVEHWFNWVAVACWPELAARLRACERIVAESPDRAERREAAAVISQILRQAETATGTVHLPSHLDWSGNAVYDLDAPGRVVDLYRAVLIEAASPQDLYAYLDQGVLRWLWALLWLRAQLRRTWEQRFQVLAEISRITAAA